MEIKCIDGPLEGEVLSCRNNSLDGSLEGAFREVMYGNERIRYDWVVVGGKVSLKYKGY